MSSLTGRTIAALRAATQTALHNQAISGLTNLSVTLTKSLDPMTPMAPGMAVDCIDGAFTVHITGRSGSGTWTTDAGYGTVQRSGEHTLSIRWALYVGACDPEKLDTDLYVPIDAVLDLIDAALEPQSGARKNTLRWDYSAPTRENDFVFYEVRYAVQQLQSRG